MTDTGFFEKGRWIPPHQTWDTEPLNTRTYVEILRIARVTLKKIVDPIENGVEPEMIPGLIWNLILLQTLLDHLAEFKVEVIS